MLTDSPSVRDGRVFWSGSGLYVLVADIVVRPGP